MFVNSIERKKWIKVQASDNMAKQQPYNIVFAQPIIHTIFAII